MWILPQQPLTPLCSFMMEALPPTKEAENTRYSLSQTALQFQVVM